MEAADQSGFHRRRDVGWCVALREAFAHGVGLSAQGFDDGRMPEPFFERADAITLAQLFD